MIYIANHFLEDFAQDDNRRVMRKFINFNRHPNILFELLGRDLLQFLVHRQGFPMVFYLCKRRRRSEQLERSDKGTIGESTSLRSRPFPRGFGGVLARETRRKCSLSKPGTVASSHG
jgi:hypothetical protein